MPIPVHAASDPLALSEPLWIGAPGQLIAFLPIKGSNLRRAPSDSEPPLRAETWAAFIRRWMESPGPVILAAPFRSHRLRVQTYHPQCVGQWLVMVERVPERRASAGNTR